MGTPGFIPNPPKPPKHCPQGHVTGTRKGKFRCTLEECGEVKHRTYELNLDKKPLDLDKLKAEEPAQLAHTQRLTMAGVPKNLKGENARQWAEQKLQELLPDAVASLSWDLKYGSDKARQDAVDKVLKANGMDKREGAQSTGGTIILNIGNGATNIPWLDRVKPSRPVVEAITKKGDDEAD